MNQSLLESALTERYQENERNLLLVNRHKASEPVGRLRISRSHGSPQYYLVTDSQNTRGKYLAKEKIDLVKSLAEKDYRKKLRTALAKEQRAIEELLQVLHSGSCEQVYDELPLQRQTLISPLYVSDQEYVKQWEKEEYLTNPYHPEELIYETKRGEFVRSKSEVFLADMYYEMNIPYRYECALYLRDGSVKYPDFTLLDVKRRRIWYHEHLGLLDREEYRMDNLLKIEKYRANGICTGYNLLITHETKYSPLNIRAVRSSTRLVFYGE